MFRDLSALIFIGAIAGMSFLLCLVEKYFTRLWDYDQYSQTQRPEIGGAPPPPGRRRLLCHEKIVLNIYIKNNSKESGGGGCTICLEEFKDGETTAAFIACNHRFHAVCIKTWLVKNDTCPLCRSHVV